MKRIYVVVEFNGEDAFAQGAFEDAEAAYNAMEAWQGPNPSANWVISECSLHAK